MNSVAEPLRGVKFLDLPGNPDGARQLTFFELNALAPFPVQRIYWIHSLSAGDLRGQHAHKYTQQLLVAVNGHIQIRLNDGFSTHTYTLDDPSRCLSIPGGLWRDIDILDDHAVLLVLASTHYDEDDYIRDYEVFKAFAHARAGGAN